MGSGMTGQFLSHFYKRSLHYLCSVISALGPAVFHHREQHTARWALTSDKMSNPPEQGRSNLVSLGYGLYSRTLLQTSAKGEKSPL